MVQIAVKLVSENGILSSPNVKPGKVLPPETIQMVKLFYVSHKISRIMPGKKNNYVSVFSR
jgi:hypothetical protein